MPCQAHVTCRRCLTHHVSIRSWNRQTPQYHSSHPIWTPRSMQVPQNIHDTLASWDNTSLWAHFQIDCWNPPSRLCMNVLLLRVPRLQRARSQQIHTIPYYYNSSCVDPKYNSPCSIVERAAFAFSPAWHAIAINN
jgi:hypothetical protein